MDLVRLKNEPFTKAQLDLMASIPGVDTRALASLQGPDGYDAAFERFKDRLLAKEVEDLIDNGMDAWGMDPTREKDPERVVAYIEDLPSEEQRKVFQRNFGGARTFWTCLIAFTGSRLNVPLIERLLEVGASLGSGLKDGLIAHDGGNSLPLHWVAAKCGDLDVIKCVLAGSDPSHLRKGNNSGHTPVNFLRARSASLPNSIECVALFAEFARDPVSFKTRYTRFSRCGVYRRVAVLESLARLRSELYARQAKRATMQADDGEAEKKEDEDEEDEEQEVQQAGVLRGALAFEMIHSDDLWRHILEFV